MHHCCISACLDFGLLAHIHQTPASQQLAWPQVSRQISGPVVSRWMSAFAGFSNCWRMYAPLVLAAISSAFATAPFIA